MQKRSISLPLALLIGATRGILGVGIGLLLSEKLRKRPRRKLGLALAGAGALSTIPLALRTHRRMTPSEGLIAD